MVKQFAIHFWHEVEKRLVNEHVVQPPVAHKWVTDYRRLLHRHHVNGVVYNRGEDAAVQTILGAIQAGGFPPEPARD